MKKSAFLLSFLFLLSVVVQAQETKPSTPKSGRYIQDIKEMIVPFSSDPISFKVVSVDVLKSNKMRINFIISNTRGDRQRINHDDIKDSPFYIIDENITKYKSLGKLKADWNVYRKKGYVLAPEEKVKGSILFPVLVEGARKFDLYIGYKTKPIKNVQLIE